MIAEGELEIKRWEWEKLLEAKDAEITELRARLEKAEAALRERDVTIATLLKALSPLERAWEKFEEAQHIPFYGDREEALELDQEVYTDAMAAIRAARSGK